MLAMCSALLHAAMLGQAANAVVAGLLAAMVAACLYCARELWRAGTERAWLVVALMNLAMIGVHLPLPAHHHNSAHTSLAAHSNLMVAATSLAFVEVLAATAALWARSRGRWSTTVGLQSLACVDPRSRPRP